MATLVKRAQELADVTYDAPSEQSMVLKWIEAGLRELIRYIPPNLQWHYTTELTDSGSGVALNGALVLGAHKSNRWAREWPVSRKAELSDTNSLYQASTFTPAFYVDGNSLYVLPGGGTAVVITAPSVTFETEEITALPEQFGELATLYAALRIILHALQDLGASLTVTSITAGSAESTKTADEDAVSAGTGTAGTVAAVTDASTLKTAADTPASPEDATAATVTAVGNASAATVTATTYTNITPPNAPTLDTPTFDWIWDNVAGGADNPFDSTQIPADITLPTPSYPSLTFNALTISATPPTAPTPPTISITTITGATAGAVTIGALPTPPAYTSPGTLNEWATGASGGFIETGGSAGAEDDILSMFKTRYDDDDSEMAGSVVQMAGALLDKYQKDLFDKLNDFNANNADFQREVDRLLKQAEIDLQIAIENARLSQSLNITNMLEKARVQADVYRSEAQAYAAAVQGYVGEVNAAVQEYIAEEVQTKLQKWLKDMDAEMAEHQIAVQALMKDQDKDVAVWAQKVNRLIEQNRTELQDTIQSNQNKIGLYQAEISEYNAAIQEHVQEVQIEQQRKMTDAELATRVAIENLQKDLAHAIKQAELNTQAAINNAQLAGQVDTAVMQADLQGKIAELQSDVQLEIANMQKDLERVVTQAKLDTDVSLADLQADTSIKVAKLNADIQGKISILQGEIQAKIANVQAQVQADIAELQATVQTNAQKIETHVGRYNWLQQLYTQGLQAWLGAFGQQGRSE